ncbi:MULTISPECIES: Uma2 family endonuclease [unclassified Moorena]|uniref:Uma2 family endonuclease n=1 Tax=unclassified Moorena TaxID=2683338 RepID=UPI0013BCE44F|nr:MULTISPECIES: Uma2 family endonuclease [unclassified Moorena]NEQ05006.1 Uma2 family endonuclease [Moorena sp. SIO4E2]NER85780.1 Uma2 family endonuclease [Moorena sp. SIO3A2]
MYQTDPPRPAKETLPTMYDLPSEDPEEPGLPDEFHDFQPQLLRETFCPPSYPRDQIFVGTDLNLYYDVRHPQWYKRPDWFGVVGVSRFYEQRDLRLSYVMWQEGVSPFIVVELLSPTTESEDLGQTLREIDQPPSKWEVYERILRIPYYVVFSRYTNELRIFELKGFNYQQVRLENERFWLPELGLGLGVWSGSYQEVNGRWLRWYDELGNWIPTGSEQAQQAQDQLQQTKQQLQQAQQQKELVQQQLQEAEQEAQLERQEKELAQQQAARLAERLRQLGIDPGEV